MHAGATDSEEATVWTPQGIVEYEFDNQSAPQVEVIGTKTTGWWLWKKEVPVTRVRHLGLLNNPRPRLF